MNRKDKLKLYIKLAGGEKQVAKELGYSEKQIKNYLNGKSQIPKVVEIALDKLLSDKAA
jgi:hypothetical protein